MTDKQFRQQQKFKNKMTLLALIYKKKYKNKNQLQILSC